MINKLPDLSACAALVLAGLALATAAPAQTAWPDPTDQSSYTFAGNRLSFPTASFATGTTNRVVLSHIYQVSPPYAVSGLRVLFANFYVLADGSTNPERCPGNPKNVDFGTIFIGGTAYPMTFGGALSARIGDCEFIWSDPLRDASGASVSLPAGTTFYIRSSQSVDLGLRSTVNLAYNLNGRFSNPTLGDGVEYGNVVQSAKRTSGTVAAFANGSSISGPAMAIATGWDGSPVFLVVGDSIGAAQGDSDYTVAARGVTGFVGRALDDGTTSTRYNFGMFAVPGTRPQDQASIATGQYLLRMRVLRSIPNKPFNRIFSEMGQNGLSGSAVQHQAAMRDWWQFLRITFGPVPIYQTTYAPHAAQTNATYWTDRVNQIAAGSTDAPGGSRDQVTAWLRSGSSGGVPAYVTLLDTYPALADAAEPQKWKGLPGSWWLTGAVAVGVGLTTGISVSGSVAPSNGDWYVFDLGTPNAELLQAFNVTGTGPWTVLFASNTAKAHVSGAVLTPAPTGEGTHPGSSGHKAAAALIIAKKRDGTVH